VTTKKHKRRDSLASARTRAGLSQVQLAERVGVHPVTIARIESGTLTPSVTVALAISRTLGETVESLFEEDD
jgi:putative transcriptional regulator